jgi:hypothetical protein
MARFVVFLAAAAVVAGCSSPVIRDAQDPSGTQHIPANITPLSSYLETASSRVNIVLVHGVGFHCPSYGLDPKLGWLNKVTIANLGLVAAKNVPELPPQFIPDVAGGVIDPNSGVYLLQRAYTYARQDGTSTDVEISEITWSGLTAWLKFQDLGADFSAAMPTGDGGKVADDIPTAIACPGLASAQSRQPDHFRHVAGPR